MKRTVLLGAWLALALWLGWAPARWVADPWRGVTRAEFERLEARRLLGIAYLENGRADEALAQFVAIRNARPDLALGYVNEAAARLRMRQPEAAVRAAEVGIQRAPRLGWPRVVLARVLEFAERRPAALRVLREAAAVEPDNARVLAALIRHLEQQPGKVSPYLYRRLAILAPDNAAAAAGALLAEASGDRPDRGKVAARLGAFLSRFPSRSPMAASALSTVRGALAYGDRSLPRFTRMLVNIHKVTRRYWRDDEALLAQHHNEGSLALREWDVPPPGFPRPTPHHRAVQWAEVTPSALDSIRVGGIAPAWPGDVGLDHVEQMIPFLAAGGPPDGSRWTGGWKWPGAPPAGFLQAEASRVVADLNSDWSPDLYVSTPSEDSVWINPRRTRADGRTLVGSGLFQRQQGLPTHGPGAPTLVDLDEDGHLDILRANALGTPPVSFLRNNQHGWFREDTAAAGLELTGPGARQVACGDFDGDDLPDLFIARPPAPGRLLLNDRGSVRNATVRWLGTATPCWSAVVGDFNRDGRWDVAATAPQGTRLLLNTGRALPAGTPARPGGEWIDTADFDNDSWPDLCIASAAGLLILRNEEGRGWRASRAAPGAWKWVRPWDFDDDGDMDLLAATGRNLRLIRNDGGNALPWIRVLLSGGGSYGTCPTSGIGTEVELVTLYDRQKVLARDRLVHLGLGPNRSAIVRVSWAGYHANQIGVKVRGTTRVSRPGYW
jgi:tetratricopeptide (TPR) repeat protein